MARPIDRTRQRLDLRPLDSVADYRACAELQRDTWGEGFSEQVPMAILKVSRILGGVATGAFDTEGRLVGFVFGMTGVRDGELVHWSDMLAVRLEWRDRGLGTILKQEQRNEVMERGVRTMHWTFDPLQSRNAYLNIVRLGAVMREYEINMYGESGSPLHQGIGTDRFVVTWEMDSVRVCERVGPPPNVGGEAVSKGADARPGPHGNEPSLADDSTDPYNETLPDGPLSDDATVWQALSFKTGESGIPEPHYPRPFYRDELDPSPAVREHYAPLDNRDDRLHTLGRTELADTVRIAIPSDIDTIVKRYPQIALGWREATRRSITVALEAGYEVTSFERGDPVSEYLLTRAETPHPSRVAAAR